MKLKIAHVPAKDILTKSKLPAADYVMNPYIGCSHACRYCYARFMGRFTGHAGEEWGTYLDVKEFDVEKLRRRIARLPSDKSVFMGSVTDVYQPAERRFRVTRQILETAVGWDIQLSILTKSDLIVRDQDLWKQIPRSSVGFTITSTDDRISSLFEPGASPASNRLQAMKILHDSGIDVYAFIGPVLPGITDLTTVMTRIADRCSGVMAETLNLKCGNRMALEMLINAEFPELNIKFFSLAANPVYWNEVQENYTLLCQQFGLQNLGFFRHSG